MESTYKLINESLEANAFYNAMSEHDRQSAQLIPLDADMLTMRSYANSVIAEAYLMRASSLTPY